jgi:2',3'-cyclic-nucleotide 2'-phosphodiesterase (5'-nucleotidase family)
MKRLTIAAALLATLLVSSAVIAGAAAGGEDAPVQAKKSGVTNLQLITVSDWHGQLEPIDVDPGPATVLGGGAAILKPYFDAARAANPNTLVFMAGDSFGATPAISNFFEEVPAVQAMNMLGVSADTFGNHNFDRGVAHLQRMVDIAEFPFVSANLKGLEENLTGVSKRAFFDVDGVRVAVIGITNEEAPELVFPGSFGTMQVTDSIEAANKTARQARNAGAQVVVILTHKGIRGFDTSGNAFGELIDFANGVDGNLIDVIVGDHTNFTYTGLHQGGKVLAVENLSKGAQFAKIQLTVDRAAGVTSKSVTQHTPFVSGMTPDPSIQAFIANLNAQLAPILGTQIGSSTVPILRSDSCGRADSRLCESRVGNVVTDALRAAYSTDFAITNSGGLRDALTCPHVESGGFCPTGIPTGGPFPITRGGTIAVLRFGNVSTTTTLSGAEIKTFLEHGVSAMPGANGRFAQVSGLCFTYDIQQPVGSRVTTIVKQAADGSCAGAAIDPAVNYTVASNDFTLSGGDGYPNVISKSTTRAIMDQDLTAYVTANSPITPTIQGRIVCTDSNTAAAPSCPVITAP